MIEMLYFLFWFNISILGLLFMFFERECIEIYKLMVKFGIFRNKRKPIDTPMLQKLKKSLKNDTPEQAKADWESVKSKTRGVYSPTAREFIESFELPKK